MKLKKEFSMKLGSTRVILAAASTVIVCLIGIAAATNETEVSTRGSIASLNYSNEQVKQHFVLPVCGNDASVRARAQGGMGSEIMMSEDAFQNIQVLKGIPVDEFMNTMGFISGALSFCCSDCHPGGAFAGADWAADTPRKQIARRMIQMVSTINRDNFQGRRVVTCWTCHRGVDRPSLTPTMSDIYGEPTIVMGDILPQAPSGPSADEIFDKYIQALGGADRLANLTSFVAKGTSVGFVRRTNSIEIFAKAPNQRTTVIHDPTGDYVTTYDGQNAWTATPITPLPVLALSGGELNGAKLDAEMSFPGQIKEILNDWRVSYPEVIEERLVQVVQGFVDGGSFATLYFDDETGLLTRLVRYAESAVGRIPTQIDYADYREIAGVMVPFRWTTAWISGRDVFELNELQPNVSIDMAKFARPTPSAR